MGFQQKIFEEDCNSLKKPNAATGTCYQVALVVYDVLEDLLCAIIEHANEKFEQVLDEKADYSGVGYEFRNAFECFCWLDKGAEQPDLFWPRLDGARMIERAVIDAISELDSRDTEILIAWYWPELVFGRDKKDVTVTDLKDTDVFGALVPFLLEIVKVQIESTSSFVAEQIVAKRKEAEAQR